jgi:hypothetical protein
MPQFSGSWIPAVLLLLAAPLLVSACAIWVRSTYANGIQKCPTVAIALFVAGGWCFATAVISRVLLLNWGGL